jgi:hypothetical protein
MRRNKRNVVIAAKDLIQGLLNTDPDKRFSIEDVMGCTWIAVSLPTFVDLTTSNNRVCHDPVFNMSAIVQASRVCVAIGTQTGAGYPAVVRKESARGA